ncbi:MAG TPA: RNase P subunit p30 family protein [archaeon]|nr:RNase P subunit p30 family protein [archaeon]
MDYYDLHTYSSLTVGENTTDEMIAMARKLGLRGIGVEGLREKPATELDMVSCYIIYAKNPQQLMEDARKYRDSYEVLMVSGGDYEVNRAACENPMIDVLCHPGKGRKDSGLDHVCVKAAMENNVAIEINFREILENYRKRRVRILEGIKRNVMMCRKFGAPVVTFSGAVTKWGMRAGRELAAVASMAGMELPDAIASASTVPEQIVMNNRLKIAGKMWQGVTVNE